MMLLKTVNAGGRVFQIQLDPELDTITVVAMDDGEPEKGPLVFNTAHAMAAVGTALIKAAVRWESLA